eukprot:gene11649-24398_t
MIRSLALFAALFGSMQTTESFRPFVTRSVIRSTSISMSDQTDIARARNSVDDIAQIREGRTMIEKQLETVPMVLQLPIGSESDFVGIIDLVANTAVIWDNEQLGATFKVYPLEEAPAVVDAELKASAAVYRAKLVELAVEQNEEVLLAYLEGVEPTIAQLKECIRTGCLKFAFTPIKQSGGSGQFAKIKVNFEPADTAEGDVEFISEVKGGSVPKEYIPGVQKGIESVLGNGVVAGFPVLGIKATLVDGSYHEVDSSVLAFEIAGRAACREGLRKCKSRLKEPVMKVDVTSPEEYLGDVIGDLNSRRGQISELGDRGNMRTVTAFVPLANMFQYVSTLRSLSKGRAQYSMELHNYDFVPPNVEKELTAKYKPNGGGEEEE